MFLCRDLAETISRKSEYFGNPRNDPRPRPEKQGLFTCERATRAAMNRSGASAMDLKSISDSDYRAAAETCRLRVINSLGHAVQFALGQMSQLPTWFRFWRLSLILAAVFFCGVAAVSAIFERIRAPIDTSEQQLVYKTNHQQILDACDFLREKCAPGATTQPAY